MNLLKDITIGQYVPGSSAVHNLDPRVKIAVAFILVIQIFITGSWAGFAVFFAFLMGSALLSGISLRYILRGLKPVILLVAITLIFNMFFSRGTVIWQKTMFAVTLSVTQEGLTAGIQMAARLILLVFSTSLLTLTTSPIQMTDALESILNPLKIIGLPAHELAMMMSIALRFIPVLIDETDKIFKAQRSRGARFGRGNIIQKAKSLLPILVPLFVHAFKHAEDLAVAMESRCYRGGEGRTRLKQLQATGGDCAAVLICGMIFIAVAWGEFLGKL